MKTRQNQGENGLHWSLLVIFADGLHLETLKLSVLGFFWSPLVLIGRFRPFLLVESYRSNVYKGPETNENITSGQNVKLINCYHNQEQPSTTKNGTY